ncbi:hypothetical protein Patl1_34779 [Pistacia atlantica]|nr:hypothetical protein Patl1_34779 [Pistacia atlantica]
MIFKNW